MGARLRRWGTTATAVFLGGTLFAIVMIPLGISGQVAEPPGENAMMAIVIGVVSAIVVVLLGEPATSLTFDQAEIDRCRERRNGP